MMSILEGRRNVRFRLALPYKGREVSDADVLKVWTSELQRGGGIIA